MTLVRVHAPVAAIAVAAAVTAWVLGDWPWVSLSVGVLVAAFGEVTGVLLRRTRPPGPPETGHRSPLSPRELEVARLVAQGLRNKEVARNLGIAERTVDNHVQHIYNRLDISSRAELALWLRDRGLV